LAAEVRVHPREDAHECALPRPVLASQDVDLAGQDLEVHAVEHLNGAERLSDVA